MEIWLDTVDLPLIEEAVSMGILHGVTTNPSIIAKAKKPLEEILETILAVQKGPVTAQVTAKTAPQMIRQGESLFSFSNRIIVKVPVNSEGLKTIHSLSKSGIPVMATTVFDENQVLLAAKAGAVYIAPYFSRICENDIGGIETVKAMMRLLNRYENRSKLIAASLRTAEQVKECVELGAHAATLNEIVFKALIDEHPMTKLSIQKFLKDWEGAPERRSLLL